MSQGRNNKSIFKILLSISGLVVLSKVLGFIKQMVTANAFGATIQTDIIALTEGLVSNTDYLLVQALSTAFIPTYVSTKTNLGEIKAKIFVSNTIKFFLVISALISVLYFLAAPIIAKILAPTYSEELSYTLTAYIRVFAPVMIVIIELSIFNALLKANEHFIPGELIGFNQSIILIALIFLIGNRFGPDTLLIGFYVYAIFNLFFLMWNSRKYWGIKCGNPFVDENVRKLLIMMGPLLLGYSMVFINQQVDKIIVSGLGDGTVTAMNYAAVLSNFIGTFIGSICGVIFTYVTQNIAEHNDEKASNLISNSSIQLITLMLPVSILTVLNSHDIVSVVFGRGKFAGEAINNCSNALVGYGFMFVPFVLRELYSRFQYGYGESRKPMINSSISIVFNIILSVLLSRICGVIGVTIATSISVLICAFLNILSSKKINSYINLNSYLKHLIKWIIGGVLCVVISIIGRHFLFQMSSVFRLIILSIISFLVYFLITKSIIIPMIKSVIRR